jgi:fructoselysine-6-P-deglycase FrlB-like protein
MSHTESEIASQPDCWRAAVALVLKSDDAPLSALPKPGERVAVTGCGTSWFMAQSYAALREGSGQGETDAFPSSEMPTGRHYDRVLALTRSGTTTEVLDLLGQLSGRVPTVAITGEAGTPVVTAADDVIVLDFANESSVVQTRFATTQLMLLRAHLGLTADRAIADLDTALGTPLESDLVHAEQFTFLGQGWTYGLAQEAALKLREAAGAWTEAYPAMEYRHGPVSITGPNRVVWSFGEPPAGLADEVARTGGRFLHHDRDPLVDLVLAQRLAVAIASARGLDPDKPRHLARSVILA